MIVASRNVLYWMIVILAYLCFSFV